MRTIKNIALAALLLTACTPQREADSIDTALMLTEDSLSFDVCFEIRMRNIMGVWVDSLGSVYLNHDFLDNPPPPPPPGEFYEYVDDREPCDFWLLREKVKRFLANPDNNTSLPEKVMIDIPLLGEYPVSKGLVSILAMDGTSEEDVERVRHEIAAAVIELRDSLAREVFGLHYGELADEQAAAINAAIPTSTYDAKKNRFYQIHNKKQ